MTVAALAANGLHIDLKVGAVGGVVGVVKSQVGDAGAPDPDSPAIGGPAGPAEGALFKDQGSAGGGSGDRVVQIAIGAVSAIGEVEANTAIAALARSPGRGHGGSHRRGRGGRTAACARGLAHPVGRSAGPALAGGEGGGLRSLGRRRRAARAPRPARAVGRRIAAAAADSLGDALHRGDAGGGGLGDGAAAHPAVATAMGLATLPSHRVRRARHRLEAGDIDRGGGRAADRTGEARTAGAGLAAVGRRGGADQGASVGVGPIVEGQG